MGKPIPANDAFNDLKELLRFVAAAVRGDLWEAATNARAAFENLADVGPELRSKSPEQYRELVAWAAEEFGFHKKTADRQVTALLALASQFRATWATFRETDTEVAALAPPPEPKEPVPTDPLDVARAEAAARATRLASEPPTGPYRPTGEDE